MVAVSVITRWNVLQRTAENEAPPVGTGIVLRSTPSPLWRSMGGHAKTMIHRNDIRRKYRTTFHLFDTLFIWNTPCRQDSVILPIGIELIHQWLPNSLCGNPRRSPFILCSMEDNTDFPRRAICSASNSEERSTPLFPVGWVGYRSRPNVGLTIGRFRTSCPVTHLTGDLEHKYSWHSARSPAFPRVLKPLWSVS